MGVYGFYWSPEGRLIDGITATSERAAKAEFRRKYRSSYARYMGEVYIVRLRQP